MSLRRGRKDTGILAEFTQLGQYSGHNDLTEEVRHLYINMLDFRYWSVHVYSTCIG